MRVRFEDWFNLVHPRVERFSVAADKITARKHDEQCRICAHPHELHAFLEDLLDVLYEQAKEIERLTAHVERHTDRLLDESEMPVLVSGLSDLRTRLKTESLAD